MKKYKPEQSRIGKLREHYNKKGIELINITTLCDYHLGESGWCNDLNEPEETIHHIQVYYRGDFVTNIPGNTNNVADGFVYYVENDKVTGDDFIILMKAKRVK